MYLECIMFPSSKFTFYFKRWRLLLFYSCLNPTDFFSGYLSLLDYGLFNPFECNIFQRGTWLAGEPWVCNGRRIRTKCILRTRVTSINMTQCDVAKMFLLLCLQKWCKEKCCFWSNFLPIIQGCRPPFSDSDEYSAEEFTVTDNYFFIRIEQITFSPTPFGLSCSIRKFLYKIRSSWRVSMF